MTSRGGVDVCLLLYIYIYVTGIMKRNIHSPRTWAWQSPIACYNRNNITSLDQSPRSDSYRSQGRGDSPLPPPRVHIVNYDRRHLHVRAFVLAGMRSEGKQWDCLPTISTTTAPLPHARLFLTCS